MKKKKEKRSNRFNIYLITNSMLLAWISIISALVILKYDMLPMKFLIPTICAIILIPALLIFFMLKKKIKNKIKGIASVISIILIATLAAMLFYLHQTFNFINNLNDDGYVIENYSVIVLNNNKYNEIEDIKNKTLGYYKNETSNVDKALEQLKEAVETTNTEYKNYDELIEKLYNEEIDSIIIEESYREIIEETKEDFSKTTKVIYKIEVKTKRESIVKNVDIKNETFNVYLSGIDTYGKISSVSRSDVNIIATVNPTTHQILLTTIPRDYYVQLDGTTGLKDKLTHAGIYGIDKSVKTIENLLDININYYVKVNFSSVEKIIDALGGVDVYSDYTFTGCEGTSFAKGYNRVNGSQALEFARTRKTVAGGDRTRGTNQQALIQAILDKAISKDIITKYTSILNSLSGTFQTNMSTDEITNIIKKQIDEMASWNVTSISLDGANGSEYTYSYSGQKLYVMIPDETTIENAKQKIKEVSSGAILESSYVKNNGSVNNPTKVQQEVIEEPQQTTNTPAEIEQPKEQETTTNSTTTATQQTEQTSTISTEKTEEQETTEQEPTTNTTTLDNTTEQEQTTDSTTSEQTEDSTANEQQSETE